jgi:hypothetical protein
MAEPAVAAHLGKAVKERHQRWGEQEQSDQVEAARHIGAFT